MTFADIKSLEPLLTYIEARTGLKPDRYHRADLLNIVNRDFGGNVQKLIEYLRGSSESETAWQGLLNMLTVGETYFQRDNSHFRLMRDHLLPELMQSRKGAQRKIAIWCAGCSTGEEAYTIAITLREAIPDIDSWDVTILATDISERAIDHARRAVYRPWSFRRNDERFRSRFFVETDNGLQVKELIRRMVTFRRGNLVEANGIGTFDIVFCRNVMLYFSPESIVRAERMLYNAVQPGGWLFVGQAEALRTNRDRWKLHLFPGAPVYQKPKNSQALMPEPVHYEPSTTITGPIPLSLADEVVRNSAYADAVDSLREEQVEEAERQLVEVLAREPYDARAHMLLAFVYANRGAFQEANVQLDVALKVEPLLAEAHYVKAMIHLEQGKDQAAQRALQAALYCDGNHALALFMLGNLLAMNGDLTRAYRHWRSCEKTINDMPDDAFISDVSDATAGMLKMLLANHLEEAPTEISQG